MRTNISTHEALTKPQVCVHACVSSSYFVFSIHNCWSMKTPARCFASCPVSECLIGKNINTLHIQRHVQMQRGKHNYRRKMSGCFTLQQALPKKKKQIGNFYLKTHLKWMEVQWQINYEPVFLAPFSERVASYPIIVINWRNRKKVHINKSDSSKVLYCLFPYHDII